MKLLQCPSISITSIAAHPRSFNSNFQLSGTHSSYSVQLPHLRTLLPHSSRSFVDSHSISTGFYRPATVVACTQAGVAADASESLPDKLNNFKDAFWRFLRPHTIRGTALARALIENPNLIKWSLYLKALYGLLGLICGNGYIVGINQIYDIGIDKVNKPYLPIAAGDLSVGSAWLLVLAFAVAGLSVVASNFGPFITSLYSLGLFLGTIYSVPPFRLKRSPVAAFLIIATVRGFLLNFGVYYAVRAALGLPFAWSPPVVFITTFVTFFALVIAITKDLPDVEGDRKFKISTFATKLGVRNIAFLGSGILLLNYIGSILAAVYMSQAKLNDNSILLLKSQCILYSVCSKLLFCFYDATNLCNLTLLLNDSGMVVGKSQLHSGSNLEFLPESWSIGVHRGWTDRLGICHQLSPFNVYFRLKKLCI
ncbi:hypothetical protein V2J09_020307 [Rumex salicifolius]